MAASLFILATHETDAKALSDEEVLTTDKARSLSERGFKFLKDPMFFAATLFLKKVERVMALLRVMTVCLLVYLVRAEIPIWRAGTNQSRRITARIRAHQK